MQYIRRRQFFPGDGCVSDMLLCLDTSLSAELSTQRGQTNVYPALKSQSGLLLVLVAQTLVLESIWSDEIFALYTESVNPT